MQRPVFLTIATLLALSACGEPTTGATGAPSAAGSPPEPASMPAELWSDAPLANAVNVVDVRESGSDGDVVVLRGTLQDFGDLATFRLVEDSLEDCNETGPEDHCSEPWDYCCEDPERLARLTVNVEFLDGDLPAEWTLRGQHALDHLSEVTVAGTLRIDDAGNLRLEATRVGPQ